MITALKCAPNLSLAKIWQSNGEIVPAAQVKWFKAMEFPTNSLKQLLTIINAIEHNPHIALVKEAIAPGADTEHLRRKSNSGIDKDTDEHYPAGLQVVTRNWIVLDIDGLPRPECIDFSDGNSLALHARELLPDIFKSAACVWQLSGSSGHITKRNEIRMHMFFMCDSFVLPKVWKRYLSQLNFVDKSIYDDVKLIFTAAPIIQNGIDPIPMRSGILDGNAAICVPAEIIELSKNIASVEDVSCIYPQAAVPMPQAAAAFVEIIAESGVLRSHHPSYQLDRSRRLAFCSMIRRFFGITDDGQLTAAFLTACVGADDQNGDHDAREALAWAMGPRSDRSYSVRKLLCDAATALRADGNTEVAVKAAYLAHYFWKHETGALL